MSLGLVPVLALGGGVVWVAANAGNGGPPPVPTNVSPSGSPMGPPGAAQTIVRPTKNAAMKALVAQSGAGKAPAIAGGANYVPSPHSAPNPYAGISGAISNGVGEKLDTIEQYAKAVYPKLTAEAKKKGAQALNNALHLDPPIKEDASWSEIAAAVGGAAGAAAGAYLGGPIGAKIGAIVGAYLGVKLEEFLSKHVDEIKAWFSDRWDDVREIVEGIVSNTAGDAADVIGDFIGDLF